MARTRLSRDGVAAELRTMSTSRSSIGTAAKVRVAKLPKTPTGISGPPLGTAWDDAVFGLVDLELLASPDDVQAR